MASWTNWSGGSGTKKVSKEVAEKIGEIEPPMAHGKKRPRSGLFMQIAPVVVAVAVAAVIILTTTK